MHSKTSKGFYVAAVLVILGCSSDSQSRVDKLDIVFEHEPRGDVVLLGSTVVLDCLARFGNNAPPNVAWYVDGFLLEPTENRRLLRNGSLHVVSFDKSDEGEYLCMVSSGQIARLSRSVTVEAAAIQAMQESIIIEQKARYGDNMLLPCDVKGTPVPKAFWTKNSQAIPFTERIIQLPSNNLHVKDVVMEDEGLYKCRASNMAGEVLVATFRVVVSRPEGPRNTRQLSSMTPVEVLIGRPVVLECLWSYSHSIWYKGQSRLENVAKLGSSLFFANATLLHSGLYVCQSSEDELLSSEITLMVFAPPSLLVPREMSVNIRLGKMFNLTSHFVGHPIPEVRWFKNGKMLQQSDRFTVNFASEESGFVHRSEMFVHHSVPSDSGVFQCLMFNQFDAVDVTFFVSTFKPVFLLAPPQNLKAKAALNKEIELSWDPPDNFKGLATYSIHYWSSQDVRELQLPTERTKETIIHLLPFTNYTFYVRAHADGESSDPSDSVSQTTKEEVPLSVPQVTLKAEDSSSITVQWEELTGRQANGVIVAHKILLRNFRHSQTKTIGVDRHVYSITLRDLVPENRYDILVLSGTKAGFPSLEDVGPEQWQAIYLSADQHSPLYFPEDLQVEVLNSSSALISWQVKHFSSSVELYGFRIQCQSPGKKLSRYFTRDSDRSYLLSGLEPDRFYELQVQSMSNVGPGISANATFFTHAQPTTTGKYPSEGSLTLKGEALNDTTVLLTLSASHGASNGADLRICYGVYAPQEESFCPQWLLLDLLASNKIYVTNLWPLTNYYFGVHGEDGWLSDIITCSTGLPVPRDVQYVDLGDDRLNISWSFPREIEGNLSFRISYTTDSRGRDAHWSHDYVHGSNMFYVLENYTNDQGYLIRVSSLLGDIESANTDVLQVEAKYGGEKHLKSQHPISAAMISSIVVAVVLVSAALAVVLSIRKRLKRGKPKGCFDKDSTQMASIKPFQSNAENAKECNGNHSHQQHQQHHHHHRQHYETLTGEPLLDKESELSNQGTAALSPSQEASVQKFESESTV